MGYAAVWQDVRGRLDSEGEWNPFFNEAKDGSDTIDWIAAQPWSNGKVAMIGGSYGGMVQWLAAKESNSHLKGLISLVAPGDFYEDFIYEGGVFALGAGAMWSVFIDGKQVNAGDMFKAPWSQVFNQLPVTEALAPTGRNPRFFRDWLSHPLYDNYWKQVSWSGNFEQFDFPVLHVGGWFDIFQKGTVENFRRMSTRAAPGARNKQELIMGPWAHQGQDRSKVGDIDFGPGSTLSLGAFLPWLNQVLKGENTPATNQAAVRVFTMGENQWHEYEAWPVPGTTYVSYYFHGQGKANTGAGDGVLNSLKPANKEPGDHYIYDPANPVPTNGGGNCCWPQIVPWGPLDQRFIELRSDVLVYSTPPLEQDVRVTGPVEIKLWISSSAPDTDFTGKLVDVAPDGFAMNLTDGIQRLAYRKSYERAELLKPGTPAEITIDLWNTSHLFLKGHRIRVEIASSNFPRYSRNLNTGRQPETETQMRKAEQTILHDAKHPSRIILPVLQSQAGGK